MGLRRMVEMTVQQALLSAVESHKRGDLARAEVLYNSILNVMPTHPDANHNFGVLMVGRGEFKRALSFFERAIESNSDQAQFWLSKIEVLIKLSKLDDASAVYFEAKERGFDDDAFEKIFEKISVISNKEMGDSVVSVIERSELLKETGRIDEAIGILSASLEANQDNIKLIDHLIVCCISGNYLELARGYIDRVRQLDAGCSVIGWSEARLCLKENKKADALEIALKTYNAGSKDADGMAVLGACYLANNNIAESVKFSKLAIKNDERILNAWVNLGVASLISKNFKDAKNYFEAAYEINSNSLKVLKLLAKTYLDLLEYSRAITIFEKLVHLEPLEINYLMNFGVCHQKLGQIDDAITTYIKVIELNPEFPDVYVNLGICYRLKGDLEKSYTNLKNALSLKNNFSEAQNNFGITLMKQRKYSEALQSFVVALEIDSDFDEAYYNLCSVLKRLVIKEANHRLLEIITKMFSDERACFRPIDISRAVISLLKFEPSLNKHLGKSFFEIKSTPVENILEEVVQTPTLCVLMRISVINDLELEEFFKKLRASILLSISSLGNSESVLEFQSALASQCFINEYIYEKSDIECDALKTIEASVFGTLSIGEKPRHHLVLCLASYKALHEYEWSKLIEKSVYLEEVYTQQIVEPEKENKLKANIPVLGSIADKVSVKVRRQYEENPYPRWVGLEEPPKSRSISEFFNDSQLRPIGASINNVEAPSILIAGCGTGQHAITTARTFKNANVTAFDLSLSSLAYAKRKSLEFDVDNIHYFQGDILDLTKLKQRFDIVESVGVLHHMDDPIAGWRALVSCLNPGGLMKIGLYSELARQHIIKMREEIAEAKLDTNYQDMLDFRKRLIISEEEHHKKLIDSPDFYSLSSFRDLIFHVQEHRFTIPEIKLTLEKLGLIFCGFEHDALLNDFKLSNKNPSDIYCLDKWNAFEIENKRVFRGLYLFWCQSIT